MDFEQIRNLVQLMGEFNLTEVKIQSDNCNLCFRRGDDRAKDMVKLALEPFVQEDSSSETA